MLAHAFFELFLAVEAGLSVDANNPHRLLPLGVNTLSLAGAFKVTRYLFILPKLNQGGLPTNV